MSDGRHVRSGLKVAHNPWVVPGRSGLQVDQHGWDEFVHPVFLMRGDAAAPRSGKSTEVNSLVHIDALQYKSPAG